MIETDTIIIGAGPAGLSIAALLGTKNIPYILLEKEEKIGYAWRTHYERLHLHTVKQYSHLPMMEFPNEYPRYVPRDLVVKYLDSYADKFKIEAKTGVTVKNIRKKDDNWEIVTNGDSYRSKRVVIAAGYNHSPKIPKWKGQEKFKGKILHSKEYRNGKEFKGKKVLLVGAGNTGGELAIDLWENGAKPTISIRSPLHIVKREVFGVPMQIPSMLLSNLPLTIADFISKLLIKFITPDLSKYGITKPSISPYRQVVEKEKIPLIDIGTLDLIEQHLVTVQPDIKEFKEESVVFANDVEEKFDIVILCTGFNTSLDSLLPENKDLLNERGYPKEKGADLNGLYFLGYNNHITGFLRYINVESQKIAKDIEQKFRK